MLSSLQASIYMYQFQNTVYLSEEPVGSLSSLRRLEINNNLWFKEGNDDEIIWVKNVHGQISIWKASVLLLTYHWIRCHNLKITSKCIWQHYSSEHVKYFQEQVFFSNRKTHRQGNKNHNKIESNCHISRVDKIWRYTTI